VSASYTQVLEGGHTLAARVSPEEMCSRLQRLYVAAVSDVLDDHGLWHQVMDGIFPLAMQMSMAGIAFTALGHAERSTDRSIRLGARMVDELFPQAVPVVACSGDTTVGHWGELLTNGAIVRGAVGAVLDGGVRDCRAILDLNFPVFCRFRSARDAKGRWNIVEMNNPVVCGGVTVHSGDIIFGDCDGVVVIPQAIAEDVLYEAEETARVENEIRSRVRQGEKVGDLYLSYQRF